MKKFLTLSLSLLFTASVLTGCGCSKKEETAETAAPSASVEEQATQAPAPSAEPTAEATQAPEATPDVSAEPAQPLTSEAPKSDDAPKLPAVSENKDTVDKNNAPKVFLIKGATDTDSLTYHLENCKKFEGKEKQEVSWEMISMIGYWQCPECNPPRYEDYKNAE